MRILFALALSACSVWTATLPNAARSGWSRVAGGYRTPVSVRPFQYLRRQGKDMLLVNLRSQSPTTIRVILRTSTGSSSVVLPPAATRRVILSSVAKDSMLTYTVTSSGKTQVAKIPLPGVTHTVIPMGEREAPIFDQLWALTPQWVMDTAEHNAGIKPWSADDLSAKAQFQYDEAGLWMRFIVTDNVFHQTRRGRDIWQEDSVEVAVQADATRQAVRHVFGFALTPDGPKAFRYSGPGGLTGTLDVVRKGAQTIYDVRIPWPDLAPLRCQSGQTFLMDFMVNDNDGFGRRGSLEWTPGMGTRNDPSQWMEWSLGPGSAR